MKALIDPNGQPQQITSWAYDRVTKTFAPIFETIPDASRVAQVQESSFEVASPLFWVDCNPGIVADEWYYQNSTDSISVVPAPPPFPEMEDQPVATGSQTL